jgi:hypothetical protein
MYTTYYNNPNTTFVAVQVRAMNEDGRQAYGVILTTPIEDGDIEYGQIETFRGDTRYTAQPTPQLYERLRGMGLQHIGYHHYQCLAQDKVDEYVAKCEAQVQFMNDEMDRLRAK